MMNATNYTLIEVVMTPNDMGSVTGERWLVAAYGYGTDGHAKPVITYYSGRDKHQAESSFEYAKKQHPTLPANLWGG